MAWSPASERCVLVSREPACQDESKQHVAGRKGTPFSLRVSGAAKLLKGESSSSSSASGS